ncbi:hypothetical protein Y032_0001g214 [Ancylostoma ceylanicum]|uniref:SXP/RAL-2 family protein Ani s 5-like cation-binding domain-containing protein n=1 Tax=Ancylostoma ceylanicum TaxID=53326 RepID=A0A016W2K6_9BILA|nr:hypothetical protein Y032_0001g214 [Ancylostoma ceylanicum]
MLRFFVVFFALILAIHGDGTLEERIQRGRERHKQAVGALIDHIFTSIEQRKEREAAERDKLKELANQLQPYFDHAKANSKREQELSDLDNALAEAQNELAQASGKTEDEKQQEIAKIRDEINKIRYGLKERLKNILGGKKNLTAETRTKAEFLNNITGTSSWQAATWLLLVLCILLSMALVGTLVYQASKKSSYERLKSSTLS